MEDRDDDSSTRSSGFSNLSLLENATATDEFGNKLLDFARAQREQVDERRMHDATSNPVLAFKRARPHPRVAAKLDRNILVPHSGDVVSHDSALRVPSESGSDKIDPPNVPRQWGRKGKQRNDFLRRLGKTTGNTGSQQSNSPEGTQELDKGMSPDASLQDGLAAAMTTKQADVSSEARREERHTLHVRSTSSKLPCISGRNASIDLEDDELPVIDSPTASISHRRRIDEAQQRARTRSPEQRATNKQSDSPFKRTSLLEKSSASAFKSDEIATRPVIDLGVLTNSLAKHDDVEPTTVPSLKPAKLVAANGKDIPHDKERLVDLAGLSRADLGDLLRQLARSGASPNPVQEQRRTSPTKHRSLSEPQIVPHQLVSKTLQTVSGWVDAPALPSTSPAVSRSSLGNRKHQSQVPATTPLEAKAHISNSRYDRPMVPVFTKFASKEAYSASLDEAGTFDSLTSSIVDDLQNGSDPSITMQLDEDTMQLISNVIRPLSNEQSRRQEQDALNRMTASLKDARVGLRDVKRGMRRVELKVGQAEETVHDTCKECGVAEPMTASSILSTLWRSFLSLFFSWPKEGNFRFTWLGLLSLLFVMWLLTETALW